MAEVLISGLVSSTATPGPCSAAATFLARTSGLDTTHTNAYVALICGLVADGVWPKLDLLHIYATLDGTTALLNLVSTSFTGIANGSPVFTADRGFLGVDASTTVYIDTGYNPVVSPGNYTSNLAHMSAWSLTNATASSSGGIIIGRDSLTTNIASVFPKFSDGKAYFRVNTSTGTAGVTNADSRGHFLASRTGASAVAGYINGSNVLSDASASVAMPSQTFKTLARSHDSSVDQGGGYQLAMASLGGALSPTDVTNFYNRLRTYMTAVGVP
jgi:hypothetical protein